MKTLLSLILISYTFGLNAQTSAIGLDFISQTDKFFQQYVVDGRVDYGKLQNNADLKSLVTAIENADLNGASDPMKQAFYINAYNLLVIDQVAKNYPIRSVNQVSMFFDSKTIKVAGKSMSLNHLEKELLLKQFQDPRFHFVLVCGAVSCPPITNFAYHPDHLSAQLDQQSKSAINHDEIVDTRGGSNLVSKIFQWYEKDFGGSKEAVISFINTYRNEKISSDNGIKYKKYDWSLNDVNTASSDRVGNNASRYIVSSTIPKGSYEIKIFNNLYSQQTTSNDVLTNRSTFFTTSLSALYGLSNRFNIGLNSRYRKVRNDLLPSSAFDVFGGSDALSTRSGLTAIGPQIRFAPVPKWGNFSIQSSFVFAIGDELEGNGTEPFIDWNGPTWNTQLFNDIAIGDYFSLFTELDFLIEDIGDLNRFSTPVTLIFSYNPLSQMIIYAIGGYSPFWQSEFDYFTQVGMGAKYQITPDFELELLYTDFSNKFLNDTGGNANTYNLGIRFNL